MSSLDWDDLRYFLAVQRARTLTGAGAKLQLNPTTVGRRLNQLEDALQARLFDRTPEGFVLTEAGDRLLTKAERVEKEFLALERDVAGDDQRETGIVRLTVTEMLATRFVVPHLWRFREKYPNITIDLVCSNRLFNLARREADISLRLARPREENVIIRLLVKIELGLYASRRYLDEHGMPEDPERSLAGKHVVLFADHRSFAKENTWMAQRTADAHIVMRSDSVSSMYSSTVNGMGLSLLPSMVADRDSRLVRIETETHPEPREVWQSVHRDLQHNARVRAVLDFLAEVLSSPPPDRPPR